MPERLVKLRLALMCSAMDMRASSGMRIRMADMTEMWLNLTLANQGLVSWSVCPMNSIMEA